MSTVHLEVQGMSCGGCVKSVTAALMSLPSVSAVEVDLPTGYVAVTGDFPQNASPLVLALTAAGYPAKLAAAKETATGSPGSKKSGGCCG